MIKRFEYPKLQCKSCKDIIWSKHGGQWVSCSCLGKEDKGCYMDRDRWFPERYRVGGNEDDYILIEEKQNEMG
jgi:hypothetical protein